MDPSQTFVWDHAFSLLRYSKIIYQNATNFLSKVKFDGESKIPTVNHLFNLDLVRLSLIGKNVGYFQSLLKVKSRNGSRCC